MPDILKRLWNMPVLVFCLPLLAWAGNNVFTRLVIVEIDISPIQISFWRTLWGLIVVTPFAIAQVRKDWHIIWANWGVLALLGISSLVGYNLFLYLGLAAGEESPSAGTINSLFPIVILAIGVVAFGERISRIGMLGVLISVIGGCIAAFEGSVQKLLEFELTTGKLWLLLAVVLYGAYMACVRLRPQGMGQLSFLWSLVFWALVSLVPLWLWDTLARGNSYPFHEPLAWINTAYLVVFPVLLAPLFVNQAIKVGGAQVPSMLMNTLPIIIAGLAVLSPLGETMHWYHWVSLALIIPGVLLFQLFPAMQTGPTK